MEQAKTNMQRVEHGVDFTTIKTASSDYAKAVFIDCNFEGMDLSFADLRDSSFINCNLKGADLSFTQAMSATFRGSDLTAINLFGANFYMANVESSEFKPHDIKSVDLRAARLPNGYYVLDRVLEDGGALTALLTPNALQVNEESAALSVWEDLVDEHPNPSYRKEVKALIVIGRALQADKRKADIAPTVELEEAA